MRKQAEKRWSFLETAAWSSWRERERMSMSRRNLSRSSSSRGTNWRTTGASSETTSEAMAAHTREEEATSRAQPTSVSRRSGKTGEKCRGCRREAERSSTSDSCSVSVVGEEDRWNSACESTDDTSRHDRTCVPRPNSKKCLRNSSCCVAAEASDAVGEVEVVVVVEGGVEEKVEEEDEEEVVDLEVDDSEDEEEVVGVLVEEGT